MRCADRTAEFLEKIIGVFDEGFHVYFQAKEYRVSFFVFSALDPCK